MRPNIITVSEVDWSQAVNFAVLVLNKRSKLGKRRHLIVTQHSVRKTTSNSFHC